VLLTKQVQDAIVAGTVTVVFRLWQKPTVKTGGRLRTSVGELSIDNVEIVDEPTVSDADAIAAGFLSANDLRTDLYRTRPTSTVRGRVARADGPRQLYRIQVSFIGGDTRSALRESSDLSTEELTMITRKLDGYDTRSSFGPWTRSSLELIATWPGRRAPELAELQGRDTVPFKADVRKLKELGLTESLAVGYRLSPRGERVTQVMGITPKV
jgi:hypothetical protein